MLSLKDIQSHICFPNLILRDVLARINASPYLFQIVVDQNNRLLGTITDGDVRRALLNGADLLKHTAAQCMNASPIVGRHGQDEHNLYKFTQQRTDLVFLPIIDDAGCLLAILLGRETQPIATAVVMAGGLGRRLGEKTKTTPKPLLEVGGRPILDHVLEKLEKAKISEIWVSVRYLGEQIEDFINQRNNTSTVKILHEDSILGTAGALANLPGPWQHPILVINGDVLTQVDLTALAEFHTSHSYDGTLGVASYEHQVPYGVVRYNGQGTFEGIDEKPSLNYFVSAGVYYLSPAFRGLIAPNQPLDMPQLLNRGKDLGLRIGLFPIHESWIDVGRPEDLSGAQKRHVMSNDIA